MTERIWIKHTESGYPLDFSPGHRVCYRLRDGTEGVNVFSMLDWTIDGGPGDIVEWFPFVGQRPQSLSMMAILDRMADEQPRGVEKQVCDLIVKRQQFGLKKYGVSVADNPLPLRAWLQHALEETLDKAIYLQRAINEIDAKADDGR